MSECIKTAQRVNTFLQWKNYNQERWVWAELYLTDKKYGEWH